MDWPLTGIWSAWSVMSSGATPCFSALPSLVSGTKWPTYLNLSSTDSWSSIFWLDNTYYLRYSSTTDRSLHSSSHSCETPLVNPPPPPDLISIWRKLKSSSLSIRSPIVCSHGPSSPRVVASWTAAVASCPDIAVSASNIRVENVRDGVG